MLPERQRRIRKRTITSEQATILQLWGVTGRSRNESHTNSTLQNTNDNTTQMNNQLTRNLTNLTNTNMSPTSQENRLDQERQTINTILNNNAATTTTLQLQNNDEQNDLHWGDKICNKLDHHLRIGCRNINGMPLSSIHSKNDEIVRDINATQFDIFGMTETNERSFRI